MSWSSRGPALLLVLLVLSGSLPAITADSHACTAEGAPTLTDVAPSGRTRDVQPGVSARVDAPCGLAAARVIVRLDGDVVPAMIEDDVVAFTPPEALALGPHVVLVRVEDANGNVTEREWPFLVQPSSTPGERHVVVAPKAVASGPLDLAIEDPEFHLDGAWVTPESGAQDVTVAVTRVRTFRPDESAPPGELLAVMDVTSRARLAANATERFGDGVDALTFRVSVPRDVLAAEGGRTSLVQALAFTGGAWRALDKHDVVADDAHAAFNVTVDAPGLLAVVLDPRAPTVRALAPADAAFMAQAPVIRARVADDVGVTLAQVLVDGRIVTTKRRDVPAVVEHDARPLALEDGWHTLVARAEDASGNQASATWTFVLDRVPPTFPRVFTDHANADGVTFEVDYVDALSGVDAASVRVELDGRDVTPLSRVTAESARFTPSKPLDPGEHVLRVSVADRAGNEGDTRHAFTLPAAESPAPAAGLVLLALAAVGACAATVRRARRPRP